MDKLLYFIAFAAFAGMITKGCISGWQRWRNDRFARGKCGFKLLQYFAAGLPAVASPVGVNRALASGGALLARTPDEWVSAVLRLRDDAKLRERMGKGARAFVARRYSAEHLAVRLSRLLQAGS